MTTKPPSRRRALLELPEALRKATRLIVSTQRTLGEHDEGKIREVVTAAFRKALAADRPNIQPIDCGEHGVQTMISMDGIYAYVFLHHGLDRANLHLQERWWDVVAKALDEAIADPECDH
jgi:hypothetical protein